MAFKIVVFCAALALANAGLAPVAYSPANVVSSAYINTVAAPVAHAAYAAPAYGAAYAAPVAVHDPHYGATSQSVVRGLGGAQAVSHYSKAVDGAFSTVRKYDTRITNDGLSAHYAAPVAHYAAAPVAHYAAGPVVAKSYAAPVAHYAAPVAQVAHHAYAAPVAQYAAPIAHHAYAAAPVAHYASAPVAQYAAPVVAKSYAAPIAQYAAPIAHHGYAAPALAAPVVAKAAIAYSPAVAVSHMSFSGLGAHYQW